MKATQGVRALVLLAACGAMASAAHGQFVNSVWAGFKGGKALRASVEAAGPATNLAFTLPNIGTVSPGGFSVDDDGDIYFKTHQANTSIVYRLDPSNGNVLAQSAELGGVVGNYAGVAIGRDGIYTCQFLGAGNTFLVKLDKDTLAPVAGFTSPVFPHGLRASPLIGDVRNVNGNVNIYVMERNTTTGSPGNIYAVDSVTGQLMWTYVPLYNSIIGAIGPMWTDNNKQRFAYFGNGDLGPGVVLEDNGDNTFNVVWDLAGPGNFNWWGSGALSEDGSKIYVTTFNDNFTASLWSIDASNGNILASVPGNRGQCGFEFNFFGRPAVMGDRVYCGGGFGVIAAFVDNGGTLDLAWEYRDNNGEHTSTSVVKTASGDVYVYALKQEQTTPNNPNEPCGASTGNQRSELVVLRDDGNSYTEILRTDFGGALRWTFLGAGSATIDADGSLWVHGGHHNDAAKGDVHKITVDSGCPCACNFDITTGQDQCDIFDFLAFGNLFTALDPCACDIDTTTGVGVCDIFDFLAFGNAFTQGCP